MSSILLINNTLRDLGHIGCEEVIRNIDFLCQKNNLQIKYQFMTVDLSRKKWFIEALNQVDAVLINGEGSLHGDNHTTYQLLNSACIAKTLGKKVILINALWHNNQLFAKALDLFDTIFVRDIYSYNNVIQQGFSAIVVPDLSLYCREEIVKSQQQDLIFTDSVHYEKAQWSKKQAQTNRASFRHMDLCTIPLFRNSVYKKLRALYIRHYDYSQINASNFFYGGAYHIGNKLIELLKRREYLLTTDDLSKTALLVTGRFHGMLLAAKYEVPFAVVSSNTPKIEAALAEMELDPSKVMLDLTQSVDSQRLDDIKDYWQKAGLSKVKKFVDEAQTRIEECFIKIKGLIAQD